MARAGKDSDFVFSLMKILEITGDPSAWEQKALRVNFLNHMTDDKFSQKIESS